jgi:uncharacterized protein
MPAMDAYGELLVGAVMVVGLLGVLVPLLPGLALVWGAGLAWVLLDGGGALRWTVLAVMSVLLLAGTVAKYVLPGRSARAGGAPWSTLAAGAAGALVGFFVIPVVGLLVGGVAGVFLAELTRHRTARAAWASTRAVLLAIGIGVLVELAAGVAMMAVWAAGVLAT